MKKINIKKVKYTYGDFYVKSPQSPDIADVYTKSETYSKQELNSLITTPNQKYVTVEDYASLPESGEADTIYRVANWDGSLETPAIDITKYSEYAWNDTEYVFLSVKSQIEEVFDISANHSGATYADLSAALGTNGTNVSSTVRKGGMSVKFINSTTSKYEQWRYMLSSTANANFADVVNWQGIDDEPTVGSDNLVKSSGVYDAIAAKFEMTLINEDGFYVADKELNVGMKYDENGLDAGKVSNHFVRVLEAAGISAGGIMSDYIAEVVEDGFFIVDENLNIGVKVDNDGIHAKNILEYEIIDEK